jgi:TetR/AcrR family transcriptional repressor of nem operon
LVQTRGFNAVSYSDIARELGITTPALHYHYRSKESLGEALIVRYTERFLRELEAIREATPEAASRLSHYAHQYRMLLSANRMCLCGILAAEYQTLPPSMQAAVLEFFRRNEAWLEQVLREGGSRREISLVEPFGDTAQRIIDTLEGAMMIARAQGDTKRFDRASSQLLHSITS